MRKISPCYKCPDRKAGCAVGCEDWADYEKERNDSYSKRQNIEHVFTGMSVDRTTKMRKRQNQYKRGKRR